MVRVVMVICVWCRFNDLLFLLCICLCLIFFLNEHMLFLEKPIKLCFWKKKVKDVRLLHFKNVWDTAKAVLRKKRTAINFLLLNNKQ